MKTIKVKIAVVVDSNGKWSAAGWSIESDVIQRLVYEMDAIDTASEAFDILDTDDTLTKYWIIAEIEIPEKEQIKEVKGVINAN